jgi:hypothetical protein
MLRTYIKINYGADTLRNVDKKVDKGLKAPGFKKNP